MIAGLLWLKLYNDLTDRRTDSPGHSYYYVR